MPIYFPPSSGGGGSLAANTPVSFTSTFALAGVIIPVQITADQNDYNPTGASTCNVMRLSSDATRTITGLSGGAVGRLIVVRNVGVNEIRFSNQDAGSLAANRFNFADVVTPGYRALEPGRSLWLQYDASISKWNDITAMSRASASEVRIGSDDQKYLTALSLVQSANAQILTPGANIAWPMSNGYNSEVTLAINGNIDAPTGYKKSLTYVIGVRQSNTGSKLLSWANCYNFGQAGVPTLSTANGKFDVVSAYCYDDVTPLFRMGFNRDV
jgi:hypothetical protein